MKELAKEKEIQMNLQAQLAPMSTDEEESVDSTKRRETLKKTLADRLTRPPPIKFYDSKIFETDLKYFREWFRI